MDLTSAVAVANMAHDSVCSEMENCVPLFKIGVDCIETSERQTQVHSTNSRRDFHLTLFAVYFYQLHSSLALALRPPPPELTLAS